MYAASGMVTNYLKQPSEAVAFAAAQKLNNTCNGHTLNGQTQGLSRTKEKKKKIAPTCSCTRINDVHVQIPATVENKKPTCLEKLEQNVFEVLHIARGLAIASFRQLLPRLLPLRLP